MNKRFSIIATKNDMIEILTIFGDLLSYEIKYVKEGPFQGDFSEIFDKIEDIPDLGYLHSDSHLAVSYLIMQRNTKIKYEELKGEKGLIRSVSYGDNDESIIFFPSGFSINEDCLIHGEFTIKEENEVSKEMMKNIKKSLKKCCMYVNNCFIGKEALILKNRVRYIMIGVGEPQEYDLTF